MEENDGTPSLAGVLGKREGSMFEVYRVAVSGCTIATTVEDDAGEMLL